MADPIFIDIPADTWTKVATSVIAGQIWRAKTDPKYLHTYRDTGGVAPVSSSEGMPIFVDEEADVEQISASSPIDVWVYCIRSSGKVRVDL